MTAKIIQMRDSAPKGCKPHITKSDMAQAVADLAAFIGKPVVIEGPLLCEDYCGRTPCECYPDSISFAKSGEPKVPA